jgi:hypothetical protein
MSGRCVAGKTVEKEGYGEWIRPVSDRLGQEISEEERRYENGDDPQLLEVIEIPFLHACPHDFQSENHLIDATYYWQKVGRVEWDELQGAVDPVSALWNNGYSSYNGLNDRVPVAEAEKLTSSLVLIRPVAIKLVVGVEGAQYRKRRVRAQFQLNRQEYWLSVTDPKVERTFLKRGDGDYELGETLLCVSLGEPYEGYTYKLVAALINPEDIVR